jgi:hypothetical protein
MAPERTPGRVVLEAVVEARRIRALPATTSDEAAAARLSEALIGGHGVDPDALVVGFVSPGQLESDMPPVSAPREEQIAAALRTCVSGRMRGAMIGGGRPETRWASVFAVDGTFRSSARCEAARRPGRPTTGTRRSPPMAATTSRAS